MNEAVAGRAPGVLLAIRLFGTPQFAYSGEPLAFRAPQRALSLLAYLIVSAAPVPRKRLAFMLWPDCSEEAALANLRRHLAILEAALPAAGGAWIEKNRALATWVGGARATTDVVVFERIAADPRRFREATALYAGDFFATCDDEWVLAYRQQLKDRQLAMLRELIRTYRDASNPDEAYACALQAYRLDPWDEDMLRAVMLARHERGDRSGALETYREFEERAARELGAEPMPESVRAFESIRTHAADGARAEHARRSAASGFRRDNLPTRITRFFGREDEIETLVATLARERLVTLWGPGGVGKTSLALEVAARLRDAFAGSVRFADLAALEPGDDVARAVARAVAPIEAPDLAAETALAEALRDSRLLLILDNCERLLDACARLCDRLLRECPGLTIVATSREPIAMQGEFRYAVAPLPLPSHATTAPRERGAVAAAVRLFADRARLELDDRALLRSDLYWIVEIVRSLDGLPLALELAAATVETLTLPELAGSLERKLEVLRSGNRGAAPRQQTLEATIAWSYAGLDPRERDAFDRLAVFKGSFDAEAAARVCAEEPGPGLDPALLGRLVSRALLVESIVPDGRRYRFLETIRAFAEARLVELPAARRIRRRHAEYITERALKLAELFWSERPIEWMQRLNDDFPDITSALRELFGDLAEPATGAALTVALQPFWLDGGRALEALTWYERALAAGEAAIGASTTAAVLCGAGTASLRLGRLDDAERYVDHAERIRSVDAAVQGRILQTRGLLHLARGRFDEGIDALRAGIAHSRAAKVRTFEALSLVILGSALVAHRPQTSEGRLTLRRALRLARRHGFPMIEGRCLLELSRLAEAQGAAETAYALAVESLDAFARGEGRGRSFMSQAMAHLARLEIQRGSLARPRDLLHEALAFQLRARQPADALVSLETYAQLALAAGDAPAAALLLGATAPLDAGLAQRGAAQRAARQQMQAATQAVLGVRSFDSAFARGRGLPLDEALANVTLECLESLA